MTDEERQELEWEYEALQQLLAIRQLYRKDFAMSGAEWEEYQNTALDRMSEIRKLLDDK